MAIISQPPAVFLSGNDALLKISVPALAGERNVRSINYLSLSLPFIFTEPAVDGQAIFVFKFKNLYLPFNIKHSPNNTGTQIPFPEDYDNDYSKYLSAVVAKLKLNPKLAANYDISIVGNYISLTAYEFGSEYDIIYENSVYGFPTHFQSGSLNQLINGDKQTIFNSRYVDYSIITKNGVSKARKSLISLADRNDLYTEINLSPYCYKDLQYKHFSFPETNNMIVQHDIANFIRVVDNTNSDIIGEYKSIHGQLPEMEESMLYQKGKNFLQSLSLPNYQTKFLTDCPRPKETDIYAPEKLYWLVPGNGDYRLSIIKKFKGYEKTMVSDPVNLKANSVIEIQASYKKISEGEFFKINEYIIHIAHTTQNSNSEYFTFVVDRKYQRFARYFLWVNKYGVYDLLRTTGKIKEKTQIQNTVIELDKAARIENMKSHIQIDSEQTPDYTVETGNNDTYYNHYVKQFIGSPHRLFLKKSKAFPITIEKSTVEIEDDQFLQSQSFTMSHLHYNDISSDFTGDEPILPDFASDMGPDFNSLTPETGGDYVPAPVVRTNALSNQTYNSVTLSGEVLDEGESPVTERGFVYSTKRNPTAGPWEPTEGMIKILKGIGIGTFTHTLENMSVGTYYVRAYAINGVDISYGEERRMVFGESIQILTKPYTQLGAGIGAVTLNAEISTDNNTVITEKGFVYSKINQTPTLENSTAVQVSFSNSGIGIYNTLLTNLDIAKYYARAYCKVGENVYYGYVMEFKPYTLTIEGDDNSQITSLYFTNLFELWPTITTLYWKIYQENGQWIFSLYIDLATQNVIAKWVLNSINTPIDNSGWSLKGTIVMSKEPIKDPIFDFSSNNRIILSV